MKNVINFKLIFEKNKKNKPFMHTVNEYINSLGPLQSIETFKLILFILLTRYLTQQFEPLAKFVSIKNGSVDIYI